MKAKNELVSCITPTLNVLSKLKRSIECYLKQTYENKEMLILFYNHDEETKDFLIGLDKDWRKKHNIRLFHHYNDEDIKLGAIRNFLIDKSNGKYCIVWDSDDFYSKYRIERQYNKLKELNKPACSISTLLVYSERDDKIRYSISRTEDGWENSLMCEKKYFPKYHNKVRNEDTPVIFSLYNQKLISVIEDSSLYYYCIHNNTNISTEAHMDELFEAGKDLPIDTQKILLPMLKNKTSLI